MHPKGSSGGGSCRCEGTEQLQFHFDHDFHEEDF